MCVPEYIRECIIQDDGSTNTVKGFYYYFTLIIHLIYVILDEYLDVV